MMWSNRGVKATVVASFKKIGKASILVEKKVPVVKKFMGNMNLSELK